ncbi:MAG: maleylpyruvate isomerase N-terminal domain-containing protein [Acidimicrobiales bacterium]
MSVPTTELEGCARSHRRLFDDVANLTDRQATEPSLLPDWTVGHVITHLARNADSVTRRLEGAARGAVVEQYPGGYAGRAAEIAAGAFRPAAALIEDLLASTERLESAWDGLPSDAWGQPTRDVSGAERPARTMVLSRWKEVEVHHADLGLGYTPEDWPRELMVAWLPRELERLAVRSDLCDLLAWLSGRGPAPSLAAW